MSMPQNGAGGTTGAPTAAPSPTAAAPAGTPQPAAPAAPAPDYKALAEAAEKKAAALEAKVQAAERERLDRLKADKKREVDEEARKRDPIKELQRVLGEDWYDAATKLKAGSVTPGAVSSSIADVEQRLEAKFAEREKELRAELAEVKGRDLERQRREYLQGAAEHVRSNPDKYPLLHAFKQIDDVGGFIDGHFQMTAQAGQGELWSHEVGAQKLEEYWAKVEEMVLQRQRGRPAEAPARLTIVPPKGDGQGPETPEERNARLDRVFADAQAAWKKRLTGTGPRN